MKTKMMKGKQRNRTMRLALVLALCAVPVATHAGGGGAGSTEITQLMNHAELVSSVAKQAQMVEQGIQAQISRLQNLMQMPSQVLSSAAMPYRSQMSDLQSLYSSVSGLHQAADSTNALFSRSMSEISATGMSPSQWLSAYTNLASTQGGYYKQQLNADMNSLSTLAQRAQNLRQVQSRIPSVTGNVQGLQLLNQQTGLLAGEMLDMHALMQRQVTLQMQARAAEAEGQGNAARLMAARKAEATQINQSETNAINSQSSFDLLNMPN
jgi:type IV secretion system protein TrbJ